MTERRADRRATKAAFAAAAREWRSTFDAIGEAVCLLDPEGTVVRCNTAYAKLVGREPREVVGHDCHAMLHGGAEHPADCALARVLSSRSHEEEEQALPDGRWVRVAVDPVFDPAGTFTGIVHIVTDVSERRKAEHALRDSDAKLRALFAAIPDVILVLDRDGRYLEVAPTNASLLYKPADELVGKTLHEIFPADRADQFLAWVRQVLESRHTLDVEYGLSIGGRDHLFAATLSPFLEDRIVLVARDVTQPRRAEQALRESEQQFRALAETTGIGILLVRGEHVVYANPAVESIIGYSPADLTAMSIWDVVHPDFRTTVRERAEARLAGATGLPSRYEIRVLAKSGAERWVELTSAVTSSRGRPSFVLTVADVTEQRRLRELQAAIYEISEATQTTGSLDDLFRAIHGVIGRLMTARNFYIALHDPAGDVVAFPYFVDERDERPQPRRPGRGLTEYILRTGRPLLVTPEAFDVLRLKGEAESVGAASIDWLGVPLISGDRTIGAMVVQTYTEGERYGEREQEILTFVSTQVAQAIERKRAEEALRESEERYRAFFDQSPMGVYQTTPDGRIIGANPALLGMLGYASLEELTARNLETEGYEPGYERTAFKAMVEREGLVRGLESAWTTKDGRPLSVREYARAVRGADGRVLYYEGTVEDVTRSLAAEQEHRRLTAAVEQAAETIVITDPEGVIQYVNPAFERISGYTRDEAIGRKPSVLKSGRHGTEHYAALWQTIKRGETWQGHFINRRKDGTLYEEEATISPIRNAAGAIVNFVAVKRDVTQEVGLEEQLRQAQKMQAIGQLAGGVAHDFNNLLQAMLSHVQLLRTKAVTPEKVRDVVEELEQQVLRGASLTRQLLLFSRRETVKPERVDLNEAVGNALQILKRLVRENIALVVELSPGKLPVRADRGQLQQVLMNLTLNASDAMPEGGRVLIRTGTAGHDEVWLAVEDTGHGIPEAIRGRIFEPFFTTKEAGQGTGLGLSVVHGIVTAHGGRIEVESHLGRGSSFRLVLPAAGAPAAEAAQGLEVVGPPVELGKGERILIVEDEDGAREGLSDILASLGYRVVAMADGEGAAALPAEEPFDLLLSDVMLPGILGPRLAEELKARWPALRVVLMSGYAEDEAVRRGVTAGTVRFLQKPFSMDALARELRAALDETR